MSRSKPQQSKFQATMLLKKNIHHRINRILPPKSKPVRYIFLISPLNSGTTVASQYIAKKIDNCFLPSHGNNEGLRIPEVWSSINQKERWNPDIPMNYKVAKEIWPRLAIENQCNTFLEASPPNLCHVQQINSDFKDPFFIFWMSNPYLHIGSCVNRYALKEKVFNFNHAIKRATRRWIKLALIQQKNLSLFPKSPYITYESFCSNPEQAITPIQELKLEINQNIPKISGKSNTKIAEIVNMTPKYIAFLGIKGLQVIQRELSDYSDLMNSFDYEIYTTKKANSAVNSNILLASEGIQEKIKWLQTSNKLAQDETS